MLLRLCQGECAFGVGIEAGAAEDIGTIPSGPISPVMTPVEPVGRTGVSRASLMMISKIWLALLIVGSMQPARPGIVAGIHREMHWVAFAGAALLLFSLSQTRRQEILRAFTVFFLGLSLELVQHLVNRNHMEWRDISDNGLAILGAFVLYHLAGAWKPAPDPRPQ